MSDIKAGVTLMQDFCRPGSDVFQSYIDYLDRDEAQRNDAVQTYNLYHDYMGNPLKTTGLFTREKDDLTINEKRELKNVFDVAQENGSIMWQTVISFDNRWLEQNGLYDSQKGYLDESKLKEVARSAINRMLEKEGLENAVWSAAIHYNTDNLHIHVATVEPYPMRELIQYNGKWEYKGKFKLSNLEACKSMVINEIMQTKEVNLMINQIIRKQIVQAKESRKLAEDPEIRNAFLNLYQNLPDASWNLMHYNNNLLAKHRAMIDHISECYLNKYHAQEYEQLRELVHRQSELYAQAYGTSDRSYEEGKLEDLRERLGNAILREVKEYSLKMGGKINQTEVHLGAATPIRKETEELRREEPPLEKAYAVETTGADLQGIENNVEVNFSLRNNSYKKKEQILSPAVEKELAEAKAFLSGEASRGTFRQEEQEKAKSQNTTATEQGTSKESEPMGKYNAWFKAYKELKKELNPPKGEAIKKEAVEEMIAAGEENPFILHLVGEIQEKGQFLKLDLEKANEAFTKAYHIFTRDEPALSDAAQMNSEPSGFDFASYVQYRIGKQLNRGWGVEQSEAEAAKWYEKSGASYARYALGNLYFYGEGIEQDYEKALDLYTSVSKNGFASLKCGEMFQKGLGCEVDQETANIYYEVAFRQFLAAEQKEPDGIFEYQLGRMLYYGEGHLPNLASSIEYLKLGTERRNVDAQYLLSKIYIEQKMTEEIPQAIEMLSELADKGNHLKAQYALGKLYITSESEYYDLDKGISYLTKAAEREHEYAQYQLGKIYTDPEQTVYDLDQGIDYLTKAAEQGNEYAQYRLGKIYIDPEQKVYDLEKGIAYLERAAQQGHEYAQFQTGKLYSDPASEFYDVQKGAAYLEQANEQGNTQAKYRLGCLYLDEECKAYEPEKGIQYIHDLANDGNEYAQVKLGCEYLKGKHVERSVPEAESWLTKAAEQGNEIASNLLKDISSASPGRRGGRGRGELDKALSSLQRSMEEEHRQAYKILREYELEQDWELDQMQV